LEHSNPTQAPSNLAIHQPILVETIYVNHTRDKDQEVGFFRRNFLIRNAMEEDVQEKSRESA